MESSGEKFRKLVNENKPLQIVGTVNAYSAIMAEKLDINQFTYQVVVLQHPLLEFQTLV
jgi:hypothetical protein